MGVTVIVFGLLISNAASPVASMTIFRGNAKKVEVKNEKLADDCGRSNPLHIQPNAAGFLQNPGAGIDPFKPFHVVLKSGYRKAACVKDYMYVHGDKFGKGKHDYKLGSLAVSIVHYNDWVPKEDRQEMTPKVCFQFCRSVPDMGFFGILNGRNCYCEPYFKAMAGDSSMCDAVCDGDPTNTCGGESKSVVYSMHACPLQMKPGVAAEALKMKADLLIKKAEEEGAEYVAAASNSKELDDAIVAAKQRAAKAKADAKAAAEAKTAAEKAAAEAKAAGDIAAAKAAALAEKKAEEAAAAAKVAAEKAAADEAAAAEAKRIAEAVAKKEAAEKAAADAAAKKAADEAEKAAKMGSSFEYSEGNINGAWTFGCNGDTALDIWLQRRGCKGGFFNSEADMKKACSEYEDCMGYYIYNRKDRKYIGVRHGGKHRNLKSSSGYRTLMKKQNPYITKTAGGYQLIPLGPQCTKDTRIEGTLRQQKEECKKAAEALGYKRNVKQQNVGHAPHGCFLGHPHDEWKDLFWNKNTGGKAGDSRYKSICKVQK